MGHLVKYLIILFFVATVTSSACAAPEPEPDSAQIQSITANALYAEREANATRFDDEFKGNWVRVSGVVSKIDSGAVMLEAGTLFNEVALRDLARDVQVSVDKGDHFEAVCRVGNYVLFTMYLDDCRVP